MLPRQLGDGNDMHHLKTGVALLALTAAAPLAAATAPAANRCVAPSCTPALFNVQAEKASGRILVTLPPAGDDGVSARMLYAVALRTGLGAAPTYLDRGRTGDTQIIAFRQLGKKIAISFENPRFIKAGGTAVSGAGNADFVTSTVWMGDIVETRPDGSLVIDIASFLTADALGIAQSLSQSGDNFGTGEAPQGAGKGFRLEPGLSAADPTSVKVFPDNIEIDARQTYASDSPGDEVANIAPDAQRVSFTVHHSFVRLPAAGFTPRLFDPRVGGFSTQTVQFGTPLGRDVVSDYANRFRLDKVDPASPVSRVKKPIIFYIDRDTPEPIRAALVEGVNWWAKAFEAAGYIDAFRAEPLPAGADPLDIRYNVVNWDDRATRGWSYGQEIVDPRTGEIVKGMVVLGSLRIRQDIQIFKALVGADKTGKGGPNDPVQVALARMRQLAAHEVGHALGFAHNFAASTQERASVMDYPAPRIGLVDGHPDLSDAYGVGVGKWDYATVDWLYGEPTSGDPQAAAVAKARTVVAAGMRFVPDDNARAPDTAQPFGGLWDDGADQIAELTRLMDVRRAAIADFGQKALSPGEPVAELRRRFVPIWLLHRYQLVSAAKSIGGVGFSYAVEGDGQENALPAPAARQRAALDAVLATITPDALHVPDKLLPLLSAANNGSRNRQYDIELIQTAGGPVFDPLAAADAAATITLSTLLAPQRLHRVFLQHNIDAQTLGLQELLDRLIAAVLPDQPDPIARRIGYRAIVTMAQVTRRSGTPPEVAAALDDRLQRIGTALAARKGGTPATQAWAASLSRQLLDPRLREQLGTELPRATRVPPGDPIGGEGEWMDFR